MNGNQSVINSRLEPWTVEVPLALSAHAQAEQFRCHQSDSQKAKQVYLNTLAVYAVNFYLQCRGFETDLEQSASWDPAMQMLMDVADLVVRHHGKLECRPVLPGVKSIGIPAEVQSDRLGYVAVQLDESLRSATLLGFVDQVTRSALPLDQLRSLAELPKHLNQARSSPLVNLSQWLQGVVAAGWQAVETLAGTESAELAFGFRSAPEVDVRRCKLIELGALVQSVVMIVTVQASEQEIDICVEVQPSKSHYLPTNVQLLVLDEDGEVVMDAHARHDNKQMQLEFSGEPGDRFSVKVVLGDVSVTENFVV